MIKLVANVSSAQCKALSILPAIHIIGLGPILNAYYVTEVQI